MSGKRKSVRLLEKSLNTSKRNASKVKTSEAKKFCTGIISYNKVSVQRDEQGKLVFPDHPGFEPNKTPKEIMQAGSFGGTYFRPIHSAVTKELHTDAWKEFPEDWFAGLKINLQVASPTYRKERNKYKVKCGASLEEWEGYGWMEPQDPYGWFQWYCRFYLGRRTDDDKRQISRWKNFNGRFKNNLINKIKRAETTFDDITVSPVIRQSLLHWGIEVVKEDLKVKKRKVQPSDRKLLDKVPII